jgi:hypothetical protein
MRCAITSRAGQIIAHGHLMLHQEENGNFRLDLRTDRGRLIQGGIIEPDGDMRSASQALFQQFFEVWGMSDLTLSVIVK